MKEEDGPMGPVLRIVTSNEGKAREFARALEGLPWRITRVDQEYEEVQADTLDEVAEQSARSILASGSVEPPFVLEDAGLFVESLGGFPGVYSAYVFRTIGCEGILRLLGEGDDRGARFESRIALSTEEREVEIIEGTCIGSLSAVTRGSGGFGFDPIFIPQGHSRTFAQMDISEKESLSHRGRAVASLRARLEQPR
jgi:XTP/dITP diphosphohydrolase